MTKWAAALTCAIVAALALVAVPSLAYAESYGITVSGNTVTGVSAGSTTLTATAFGKTANVSVAVTDRTAMTAINISGATVTLDQASYTYDGTAKQPAATVTLNGKTLTQGTDYTVAYSNNTNAGTATVTITGAGSYTGTASTTFTIAKATYTGTIQGILYVDKNAGGSVYAYDFTSQLSGIDGAKVTGVANTGTSDLVFDCYVNLNIGKVVVVIYDVIDNETDTLDVTFESDNYEDFNGTLIVTTRDDAGVTLSSAPTSVTYGDADFTLTASVTDVGTGVGTYTWTSSDASILSVTPDATDPSRAVVKVLAADTAGATISVTYSSDTTVGMYTTANIPVNKKALTIAGVSAADKVYDGTTDATITGTATLSGVLTGDDVSLDSSGASASFADANAGEDKTVTFTGYALTGADAANYTLTQPASVTAAIKPSETPPNAPSVISAPYTNTTLADVTLPSGWEWTNADAAASTQLEVGVSVVAAAKYTAADAGNYATTEVDVKVTRSACTHPADKQETRGAKDATCTDAGYTGDTYCTQCETTIAKGSEIAALGHNYASAWTSDADEHWHECARCGTKGSEAAHSFTTVIDKAATATEAGSKHDECSICGYALESVTIPATGSSDTSSSSSTASSSSSKATLAKTGDSTTPLAAAALALASAALACTGLAVVSRGRRF